MSSPLPWPSTATGWWQLHLSESPDPCAGNSQATPRETKNATPDQQVAIIQDQAVEAKHLQNRTTWNTQNCGHFSYVLLDVTTLLLWARSIATLVKFEEN